MMTNACRIRALQAGLAALLLIVLWPGHGSAAPEGIVLAPHRAIYELTLATTRGGTGVSSVAGRMAYELTGSACEGYTQSMRFVTRMTNQSGNTVVTDLRSTTWEDGDGKRFRFDFEPVSRREGDRGHRRRCGAARRQPTTSRSSSPSPPRKRSRFPARVYFPVQHTIALIEAAKAGKASFRADLYDGSEKGEKVYDTVAAIGRPQAAGRQSQAAGRSRMPTASTRAGLAGVDRLFRAGVGPRRTRCRSTSLPS